VILGRVELMMGKVQEAGVRRSLDIIQRTAQDGGGGGAARARFSRVQPVPTWRWTNQLMQEVVELTRRAGTTRPSCGQRIEVKVEAGSSGRGGRAGPFEKS